MLSTSVGDDLDDVNDGYLFVRHAASAAPAATAPAPASAPAPAASAGGGGGVAYPLNFVGVSFVGDEATSKQTASAGIENNKLGQNRLLNIQRS